MKKNILPDYLSLINHQITVQETLLEYHQKGNTMLKVLVDANLPNDAISTIYSYLWEVNDNITRAKNLNEQLLNRLREITYFVEPSKRTPKEGDFYACC